MNSEKEIKLIKKRNEKVYLLKVLKQVFKK